jgi:hypothetical protein
MKPTYPHFILLSACALATAGFVTKPSPKLADADVSASVTVATAADVKAAVEGQRGFKLVSTKETAVPQTLTSKQLIEIKAAGSACRKGCDNPNEYCTPLQLNSDIWSEHYECAWAYGGDNCTAGADDLCRTYSTYSYMCGYVLGTSYTHTSTCGPDFIPLPPSDPPGGN